VNDVNRRRLLVEVPPHQTEVFRGISGPE